MENDFNETRTVVEDSHNSHKTAIVVLAVGLAVALANAPAVLLADEPTGELDRVTESRVLDLLSVAAAGGTAILVASHSPAVAAAAARVIRLDDGRVCC